MSTGPVPTPSPSPADSQGPSLGPSPGGKDAAARVARLFERHGRMVYGISRALLRDPHDAEDATQQTFLSAHRALLGGARIRDDGAWLATIARNECRGRIAAGMRAPLPLADEDLEAIPTATDELERSALAEELRSAIVELPERQQEAVVLRHLYGLSYGEVATALGLSRPATEALLFRARRAMRLRLRPAVATAIVVPLSVQEGLAQAIPGFAAAGAGGVLAGAAGGGLFAKLASAPVAAKFATAAVAVTTVGAVGTVESERAGRDRAERGGLVTNVGSRASDDDSSGPGQSGRSEEDDEGTNSDSGSSGSGDDDGEDNSGPGSTSSGSSTDDDREIEDDSSSSGSEGDDERSGPSGSSSDGEGDGSSGSDGSGGDDDSDTSDDSSGSGSSGSSGSGSDEDTADDTDETDSSRHGSGSDDESGSSGSGSSGSGDDGADDEPDEDPDD